MSKPTKLAGAAESGSAALPCSPSFVSRTDALSERLKIPLHDLHPILGISTSTLFSCRCGARKVSGKTLIKLDRAEASAGMKSSDSPQKPDDPVRVAYSRDELTGLMVEWMCKKSGEPEFLHEEAKERWFANAGRLFMFIRDHFPVENV